MSAEGTTDPATGTRHPSAHRRHHHHIARAAQLGPIRKLANDVDGINAKTAVAITGILGSMAFFWFANVLALISLPAVLTLVDPSLRSAFPSWLTDASLIALVAWVAQTYIQLVSLPVLQVSNNAQGRQLDHTIDLILEHLDRIERM